MLTRLRPAVLGALAALLAATSHPLFAFQNDAAAPPAGAANPAPADASGAERMTVVIAAVKGLVQVRENEAAAWQKAAVGMQLTEGAEFRTGPRSSVTCTIPPDQTIVLDRLGTVKVMEAIQTDTKVRTDLVMRYGRTDYAIEAAGREHDSTIRSPTSTLAVRGTSVRLYDQPPFAPEAETFTGRATYQFAKRQMAVRRGGRARGGRGSAEVALLESVVDPSGTAAARTASDATLVANEESRGAVVTYDPTFQVPIVRGGPGPRTDAELAQSLPGVLNFVIRWETDVDVDVVTTVSPGDQLETLQGEFKPETVLLPFYGLNVSPSGGRIAFDHRGGPNGGQEICFWPSAFPTAVFGFGALNNSATESVEVRFNAFLDGERLTLYTFDERGALVRSKGFRRTIGPDDSEALIALAPPVEALEDPAIIPELPDETLDGTLGGDGSARPAAAAAAGARAERTAAKEARRAERREHRAAAAATRAERSRLKQFGNRDGLRGGPPAGKSGVPRAERRRSR